MKLLKFSCVILVLLMLVPMLFACKVNGKTDDTSDNESTSNFDQSNNFDIMFESLSQYNLIRPDDSSSDFSSFVTDFYSKLKNILKVEMSIKTDFFKEGNPAFAKGEYEILVGNTNRTETQEFLKTCLRDEYGYKIIGKKIVICGGTEEATEAAMTRFLLDIVYKYKKDTTVFMAKDATYKYDVAYPLSGFKLNNVAIEKYKIVYKADNKMLEKSLALNVQNQISIATGYILKVNTDNVDYSEGDYEILIGDTNRDNNEMRSVMQTAVGGELTASDIYIGTTENFVWCMGATSFALSSATSAFVSKIDACIENSVKELQLAQSDAKKIEMSNISVMSFNVWTTKPDAARIERVVGTMATYTPDLIGIQEGSPYWMGILKTRLSPTYAYVGVGRDGGDKGEYNAIFYSKEKFSCIESGTKWLSDTPDVVSKYTESSLNRIFTYAILERKDNGTRFLYINTHLEHTSEDARIKQVKVILKFVQQHFDLPIIISGDFNAVPSSDIYTQVMDAGFADCGIKAIEKINQGPTFRSSERIIDYIFISSSIMANKYKVITEKVDGEYPSDHFPIYSELSIIK